MYSALSTFNTTTEVPLSKAPNPQLLPGHRSINGCPLLWVCVHGVCVCVCVHCCLCALWMGEMQSRNSEYGSPYVTSLSLVFPRLHHCLLSSRGNNQTHSKYPNPNILI